MTTFADHVIAFNQSLYFTGPLPEGIRILNPFKENEETLSVSSAFYQKYYADNHPRRMILGINPGRFGGGVTGVPFTDSKRLKKECNLSYSGKETHEPSSVFVYEVIAAFGGVEAFYRRFYINSICPLGFTKITGPGKEVNYNYYDSRELTQAVYGFIVESIWTQIGLGVETDVCFCFGIGKNEKFLRQLNHEQHFFRKIVALEHPRFVMQYKAKTKDQYIQKYLSAFGEIS